jgi:hypothetical protein
LAAKAGRRSVKVATGAALDSEGSPASFAILIGDLILATATHTLHRRPPWRAAEAVTASVGIALDAEQFYAALQKESSGGFWARPITDDAPMNRARLPMGSTVERQACDIEPRRHESRLVGLSNGPY